jgi:arylsulfatase A-like enzyme
VARNALVGAAFVLLIGALAGCSGGANPPESIVHRRPNLVYVVVDDLDQTTSPNWKALPKTKELVADRGMTFENAFATDPVCCPARATLLTGMYPHNTNVYESSVGLAAFQKGASRKTIAVRLKAAGYTTAFIGKYLDGYELDPSYVPPGWDEWFGLAGKRFLTGYRYEANHNGRIEKFGRRASDYQTDVMARRARSFVARATHTDGHEPFLLTLFPTAPHAPIGPAPRHENNTFRDDPLPPRKNYDEKDVSDKPTWLRGAFPRLSAVDKKNQVSEYRRALGSLLAVDDMVDAVAKELRKAGEIEDTVFVFTSDNGYSFGSHRIPGKVAPYDEPARVPLAIAGRGIEHGTNDDLVAHIDMAGTLYDLAGVPQPSDVDGRSLLPLLQGHHPRWRKDFMIEYRASPRVALHTYADVRNFVATPGKKRRIVPDYRALRSADWLYVEWYQGAEHDYELYDMRKDPFQMTNLMADPAYAFTHPKTISALHDRLAALAMCRGATCR